MYFEPNKKAGKLRVFNLNVKQIPRLLITAAAEKAAE